MEIADVRVRLDKLGSDVPKSGVTPAEALILHVIHQANNGGSTFGEEMDKIKVTGEAETTVITTPEEGYSWQENYTPAVTKSHPRTNVEELKRLQSRYGGLKNKKGDTILSLIWPDKLHPQLPQRFEDIVWKDIQFDGLEVGAVDLASGGQLQTR
jgi:hypothetical protein